MEEFDEIQIATTLGRIWCEELDDLIDFDILSPQNGYEIISDAASGNWMNYLMGTEIDRDVRKISKLAADFYEVDSIPEEIFVRIIKRVKYEYQEHPQIN
ncbi:hypothetical protein [Chamaesiphon sp. VAR_48_metabat_403]|uniref:hypothetical protein n=1 Tax=Chamaesiphon sp. VAR_48_metabat_403 TaxID=2964700 RepID=UPI00286E8E7B|nr:hypothetical protein [Chamaesiphon sp. VAR_48_metabat_403]